MSTSASDAVDPVFDREIRQIIPSPGYSAIFFDEEDGEPWADSLVGWALVAESSAKPGEPPSHPSVIGLVADGKSVLFVDEFPNFVGYLSPEGRFEDWTEDVRLAWEQQQQDKRPAPVKDEETPRALQRKKTW
jgi:hypothetical protein